MNYIKDINSFINEAISMKMYKENLPKELWYDKSFGYKEWDSIFGKGINRISIPLSNRGKLKLPKSIPLMDRINKVFIPLGYKINSFSDYLNNKVYKIGDTKNPMKIGKLLSKSSPLLFKEFDVEIDRKYFLDIINTSTQNLKVVISRHPYDLLGMASGRDWRGSSCMRLGSEDDKVYLDILASMGDKVEDEVKGLGKNSITQDIIGGTLVAYVVDIDDNNINKPISRLLIKPYYNKYDSTDIVWVCADRLYGKKVEGFKETIDSWIESWQGKYYGFYCIKDELYGDKKEKFASLKPIKDWTEEDVKSFVDGVTPPSPVAGTVTKWSINSKGEIQVDGSVYMDGLGLTEIPVKFGKVSGSFYCNKNNLTTLKNSPSFVGGDFKCSDNNLTDLVGSPDIVKEYLDCNTNELTTLKGAPSFVGGGIFAFSNRLTNLKYFPKSSNDKKTAVFEVTLGRNQLTTLQGGPKYVKYRFDCAFNHLKDLKGAPIEVGTSFDCSYNDLTSIEGIPKKMERFSSFSQTTGYKVSEQEVRAKSKVYKVSV